MDFDMRANILSMQIDPAWAPEIQKHHRDNKARLAESLLNTLGVESHDRKLQDFTDMGPSPFSVVAFHNRFFRQARLAFAMGAYYPALTAVCSLGERVLNHVILAVRGDYKATDEYKAVYRKDSFDNWDLPIDTLESWGVLLPEAAKTFRALKDVRNGAIHFRPETDEDDRTPALEAIKLFSKIVEEQFSSLTGKPWYIQTEELSLTFVKKDAETQPFVAKVVLPTCVLVTPRHRLEHSPSGNAVRLSAPSRYRALAGVVAHLELHGPWVAARRPSSGQHEASEELAHRA
jgi:hypothetical protein